MEPHQEGWSPEETPAICGLHKEPIAPPSVLPGEAGAGRIQPSTSQIVGNFLFLSTVPSVNMNRMPSINRSAKAQVLSPRGSESNLTHGRSQRKEMEAGGGKGKNV